MNEEENYIAVRDTGIGMTSLRTRLFDTWHQKDERPSSIALKLYGQLCFP